MLSNPYPTSSEGEILGGSEVDPEQVANGVVVLRPIEPSGASLAPDPSPYHSPEPSNRASTPTGQRNSISAGRPGLPFRRHVPRLNVLDHELPGLLVGGDRSLVLQLREVQAPLGFFSP